MYATKIMTTKIEEIIKEQNSFLCFGFGFLSLLLNIKKIIKYKVMIPENK